MDSVWCVFLNNVVAFDTLFCGTQPPPRSRGRTLLSLLKETCARWQPLPSPATPSSAQSRNVSCHFQEWLCRLVCWYEADLWASKQFLESVLLGLVQSFAHPASSPPFVGHQRWSGGRSPSSDRFFFFFFCSIDDIFFFSKHKLYFVEQF